MITKSSAVAFTGYRTAKIKRASGESLSEIEERVFHEICRLIEIEGKECFITGMSEGFDMLAASAVIKAKAKFPQIKLVAAIPFNEQPMRYSLQDRELYKYILTFTDEKVIFGDSYHLSHYFTRNDFMVDNSDCMVCFYDGQEGGTKYTFDRATKCRSRIINICKNYSPATQSTLFTIV